MASNEPRTPLSNLSATGAPVLWVGARIPSFYILPYGVDLTLAEKDLTPIEVVLTKIEYAAQGTYLVTFQRPDRGVLPAVTAGAHLDVTLKRDLQRQYSLTNPGNAPREYVIGVKRDPASRGGSKFIHDEARPGMRFSVMPPRNNFALDETAEHSVFIAGGIGITPIYAMIKRLDELGRPWTLFHACRAREEAAFMGSLSSRDTVHYHFDQETGGHFQIGPVIKAAPANSHFYCCGPTPMLEAFEAAVVAGGVPSSHVHVEYFTQKYEVAREGGFVVELAGSGLEVTVEKGASILDAVRSLGIDVPSSCEEGICGSCETRVISGTPDHRDSILTEEERARSETMMICCGGCKSDRLVLDL